MGSHEGAFSAEPAVTAEAEAAAAAAAAAAATPFLVEAALAVTAEAVSMADVSGCAARCAGAQAKNIMCAGRAARKPLPIFF
jgi:hypothetical protein